MDYKVLLMKVLDCFGETEGTWFESSWEFYGISKAEAAEINKEYIAHKDKLTKE